MSDKKSHFWLNQSYAFYLCYISRSKNFHLIHSVHVICTARITILASRLAAGVVNFDSSDDVVISAADAGAPVSSTRAVLRVVRGPGVYGIVNVPFQVTVQGSSGSDAVTHVAPSSGVVTLLDRKVSYLT